MNKGMSAKQPDYRKLFYDSPLARLIIGQDEKGRDCIIQANKSALKYFQTDCAHMTGKPFAPFLDLANTDHILQALSVCRMSKVSVSIQVVPKTSDLIQVQSFQLTPVIEDDGTVLKPGDWIVYEPGTYHNTRTVTGCLLLGLDWDPPAGTASAQA